MNYIYRDKLPVSFNPAFDEQKIREANARHDAEPHTVTMDKQARYSHVNPARYINAVRPARMCAVARQRGV
jgi:hypothetical protein